MKIVKAGYTIMSEINGENILKLIEKAGRTCYKSENLITADSAVKFVKMIINRGHESVLEHEKITVKFICDRGVSHELVRHRIASFSQESTRYVNYSKKGIEFIMPFWLLTNTDEFNIWKASADYSEKYYNILIDKGWKPEQARSVLTNSLKTEIVVTANLREWRTILKQRTAKEAHPQMREIMVPLLSELKSKIPVVFDDITVSDGIDSFKS